MLVNIFYPLEIYKRDLRGFLASNLGRGNVLVIQINRDDPSNESNWQDYARVSLTEEIPYAYEMITEKPDNFRLIFNHRLVKVIPLP